MDVTEDVTNTLRAGANHPPLVLENHSQDSRYTGPLDVAQTVLSTYETGGNNQPFVVETPKTLKIRSGCEGGGKGALIQDNKSATLGTHNDQTLFEPKVYGICSKSSNAMKSSNPHSGIYEAETSRTLDLNGGNPACNQGGMMVVRSAGFDGNMGAKAGNIGYEEEKAPTLNAGKQMHVVFDASRRHNYEPFDDVCETVQAHYGTGGGNVPIVLEGNGSRPSRKGDGYKESEVMYTLNATEQHAVVIENHPNDSRVKIAEDGVFQTLSGRMGTGGGNVPMVMALAPHVTPKTDTEGIGFTLNSRDYKDPQCVAYGLDRASFNQGKNAKFGFSIEEEKIGAQTAKGPGAVFNNYIVRRLTPMECERLQGFPDNWTNIGEWVDSKGKVHKDADSPRYKALGNSIALPFWQWLAGRMMKVLDVDHPTMASLFDGIGGFPLVFGRVGCETLWISEIEEFPLAVTQRRFGNEL